MTDRCEADTLRLLVTSEIAAAAFSLLSMELCDRGVLPSTDIALLTDSTVVCFQYDIVGHLLGVEIALCVSCPALWMKKVSSLFSSGLPKVQGFRPS